MTNPNWAAWTANYCGTWHLKDHDKKKLEVGMLVVKLPDGTLCPGVVHPNTGILRAGGYSFQAKEVNGEKQLEVGGPKSPSASGDGFPTPIYEPTEGEIYLEEDETTIK